MPALSGAITPKMPGSFTAKNDKWGLTLQSRSNHNKATCALANKLARICYATLRDHEPYERARLTRKSSARPSRCRPEQPHNPNPPTPASESTRPSWPTGLHPQRPTPITTLAVPLPLATIGASLTQIPCRHGTPSHHRCRIYDCRQYPLSPQPRRALLLAGGVHIRFVRPHPRTT
jgi:hypothetical protein